RRASWGRSARPASQGRCRSCGPDRAFETWAPRPPSAEGAAAVPLIHSTHVVARPTPSVAPRLRTPPAMQKSEEVARLLAVARDFRFAMLTTVATDQHLHA